MTRWIERLARRRHLYEELDAEIRAHLEEKTDDLVARGVSPAVARDAARRAFGNVTNVREAGREEWQWPTIESVLIDTRYALRQIRRTPALSGIVIATLALGIAAAATVFSWTRDVLLDPLPGARDAARIMAIETTSPSGSWTPTSWLDYRDFRRYLKSFDGIAAAYPTPVALGDDAHVDRAAGELVSANFFAVLRVHPELGAFFPSSLDEAEGAQPTAVISYDLWQKRWHGDSAVIGRLVNVNRFPFTIVGVAPKAFRGSMPGQRIDVWVPAAMLGQIVPTGQWWLKDRGTRTFRVLARLRDGVTFAASAAEVASFTKLMAQANGGVSEGMGGLLMPIWKSHWGMQDNLRAPLIVLLAACGLVLLIVCANAANLLLARTTARARELALRLVLGAPRRRLVRQLLTEASLLAASGAVLGFLAAVWLARSLTALVPSFVSASLVAPHVDGVVLGFTALVAAGVTLLAGVAPALHGSRDAFASAAHDGSRTSAGGRHATHTRRLLVVAEMALAVVALVAAGLFYESFRNSRSMSPGFETDRVAMASVSITLAGYDSAHGEQYLERVADRLRREPGVVSAAYTDYVPLSIGSGSWENLDVEGYAPRPNENMRLNRAAISPDYFRTLGIPLVAGRDFTAGDDSAHSAVMIVNQAFVHRFLNDRTALGVRVHGWGRWFTIVGVAKDTKTYRVTDAPAPYFYVPVRQVYRPEYGYTFLVRGDRSIDQLLGTAQRDIRGIDPSIPVYDAMTLAEYVQGPLQSTEAATRLLVLLAAIASILAAIGLYGIVAFAVTQRTREIGVRVALGARPRDIVQMIGSQASGLLGVGLVTGFGIALAMARIASSMLYLSHTASVFVFVGAGVAMIAIALFATSVPARRAVGIDPLLALRSE